MSRNHIIIGIEAPHGLGVYSKVRFLCVKLHAAQRTVVQFCAETGIPPLQTLEQLKKPEIFENVSRTSGQRREKRKQGVHNKRCRIEEVTNLSKTSVHRIITDDMNMARIGPLIIENEDKDRREEASVELLARVEDDDSFFDCTHNMTAYSYVFQVFRCDVMNALRKKRPALYENPGSIVWHQDNAVAHTANVTQLEIDILDFKQLQPTLYSPDLDQLEFGAWSTAGYTLTKAHDWLEANILSSEMTSTVRGILTVDVVCDTKLIKHRRLNVYQDQVQEAKSLSGSSTGGKTLTKIKYRRLKFIRIKHRSLNVNQDQVQEAKFEPG
ncbi:hypothetical protein MAR_018768 [Mya arenaria]|uniref:Transposase n=1 Tax=Mya arenaria TaxID=6604 RepID=A0ABY7EFL8_MYAAR|nr:hypothetical protein MAR_018768 [Mya arenaria]